MKKGNLLIVDDESAILKMLSFNLEELADKIFTAENGLVALEKMNDETIHCVICDINMPKMNGVEVIRNIREKGNDVPFIFYTGHGCQELMLEAVKFGAFDFLNKPNLDGLEDVVTRGLARGIGGEGSDNLGEESLFSEYQQLLNDLQENEK